jgi:uncharacterized protein
MKSTVDNSQSRKGFSRRDFLKLLKAATVELSLLGIGGAAYGYWIEPNWLKVEKVNLTLERLKPSFHGLSIAQISDIHMGGWMNMDRLQHVVEVVLAQKPEMLLMTGDYLTGHIFNTYTEQSIRNLIDVLAPLAKSIPSFAVLGNHDYWTNAEAVREMLRACQITDLTNTVFTWRRGAESLHLCGLDDVWEGDVRLNHVLDQLPEDGPAILLVHEPDYADTSAMAGRIDLQVSGHSHGGQIVLPFYGPPILPYLGRKYPRGLYQLGKMFQYTNRGVGMLDPPVRFNCAPEITLFTLQSKG